jgi:hypothetical protein
MYLIRGQFALFVHDIFRAIAKMCRDAGSKKITCVSMMARQNWDMTGNAAALQKQGSEAKT